MKSQTNGRPQVFPSWVEHIGKTPLLYLKYFSEQTGNHLFGKAEFLNPAGSIKDRTALGLILEAEKNKFLNPQTTIYEGTAGNTGIALGLICKQKGYRCHIVLPDNQSPEKYELLRIYNIPFTTVKATSFQDPNHFYHVAGRMAQSDPNGYWLNQFENLGNFQIHYQTTGPEIFQDLSGNIDFFASSCGTGGSFAGISCYLKEKNSYTKCYLIDPMGSGLYSYVKTGTISTSGNSITEGIGIMRLTQNFMKAQVDDALQIDDQEMLKTWQELRDQEGLALGLSSALNVCGLVKISKMWGPKNKIGVTLLCDGAQRYLSKLRHHLPHRSGITAIPEP
ncbi:MAG: pyridoxal-phosphate dependent enzyme [Bdellovibrionaceae bacterium]|nr:pyridoxal-phosphate dependent enzyme [Pseudobdellovibrionaceae bacterium]MDW8191113.1 pyridoxal-phosphate dependent enzyme [Pseudobdellovibrionaceae bacterium]